MYTTLRALRARTSLLSAPSTSLRTTRFYSSQPPPQQSEPPPQQGSSTNSPYREFYKGSGRAVSFNFLVALATFQVLYWSWLKLETMESQREKTDEIQSLENELKSLVKDNLRK